MRLSVRLLVLGVTGPLVGLGLFLGLSTASIIDLAKAAKVDLRQLFDEVNLNNMRTASEFVTLSTNRLAKGLELDVSTLTAELQQSLSVTAEGTPLWKGQALPKEDIADRVMQVLSKPLRSPEESTSVFLKGSDGTWKRLAGITSEGKSLPRGWPAPTAAARNLEALMAQANQNNPAVNTMIKWGDVWQMSRVQALVNSAGTPRLALGVSLPSDAATIILETSSQLLPYREHKVAFFGRSANGGLVCNYATPTAQSCEALKAVLMKSGGIPEKFINDVTERRLKHQQSRLFVAGFPLWNWLAVVQISNGELESAWAPLRKEATQLVSLLLVGTGLLIAGCAIAAWKIGEGIKKELRTLADGANAIAAGNSRLKLAYSGDDALGRLVEAFNQMAKAVGDREDRLKERIQTLEININERELHGQVRSITDDPHFNELSSRAKAMRNRRQARGINPPPAA
ncbi:MAG: HAMP domain-containing protein [Vulcanococcus sp.]